MKKHQLLLQAVASALEVLLYVVFVAWILRNGEKIFGAMTDSLWGPALFLLLFVLSAAVVGLLIFGRPAYLFLTGNRSEAVRLILYTIASLFITVIIVYSFFAVGLR